ncbi:GvpL/GvpF family gas vesicle protein [Streptomyces sp. NPDC060232]|uniref:GvpL/GvpF family gas vesicle protein n=1 Tax=Streptomyces sp. NPDC060232 TaxID=3347079 RepID=UPI0036693B7E
MSQEPTLTYVYAVAVPTPELGRILASLRGVADAALSLLPPLDEAGPAAPSFVTSQVPHGDWREEALRAHFEDLDWLESTARAHHHVIQALGDRATVLPLRMATLYQDEERALAALREQRPAFADRLALLAHHAEYGVKVYVRPEAAGDAGADAPDSAPPAATPAPAPSSPGKAYLQARKRQHHAREDRYQQAARAAERIAAAAAPHATHAVRHPTQSGPLTRGAAGEDGENVLNDAYLVPDEQAEAFRSAVEQAGEGLPGVRVDVTGPWAPYSFAMPAPPATGTDTDTDTSTDTPGGPT